MALISSLLPILGSIVSVLGLLYLAKHAQAFLKTWSFGKSGFLSLTAEKSAEVQTDDPERVTPLLKFDWKATKPIPYRPYQSKMHVAMGIQKCPKNDWIQIDNGYLNRLAERAGTVAAHPEDAVGVNEHSKAAIKELYTRVIEHIPVRFPTMFRRNGSKFDNLVTGKTYDVEATLKSHDAMLRMLSENVEEDFYFMCPDEDNIFRLQGYIAAFPGGFLSPGRVGQSIRQIHEPVPGYVERIGNGVDKFFQRMQGNQLIQRFNWSLQVDGPDLFRLDGNNFYPEQGHELPEAPEKVQLEQCWLRAERQSLICLPQSRAIVFCVRSYMTHLRDIKAEGSAVELADAVESMPEKLGHYKKRPFWEKDVYAYLRG